MDSIFDRIVERIPIRTGLGLARTIRHMNPVALARDLWGQRELILQLSKRDILARYRGSYLGILWALLTPLFMLTVFTLVFGVILRTRWGMEDEGRLDFALVLFTGLVVFNVFSECVLRAPGVIVTQPQYVKRVAFPLQILPVVILLSASAHGLVSLVVLMAALWLVSGVLHWTALLAPLVLLPLLMFCLGLSWFLASLGVYIRDVSQMTGIVNISMLFLSPIFYPLSAIPESLRPLYQLNPLTSIIEATRAVLVWGQMPTWQYLTVGSTAAGITALMGYAWFQRTRGGFADVL